MARTLHQFPISHYCEKTRWNLDVKGLTYDVKNVLPGPHTFWNRRLSGKRTVPLLVDGASAVADSTDIALYLDERYPARPVLPAQASERTRALELEDYFDGQLGPSVRRWMYGLALGSPGLVPRLFFDGYDPLGRLFGKFAGALLSFEIRRMYRIDAAGIAASSGEIDEGASRLETELGGRVDRYLVGGRFTLADLAAASLLAPLVGPPGTPWAELEDAPEAVVERRGELRARLAGQWVLERYARDRRAVL